MEYIKDCLIALFGASGNMGRETLRQFFELDGVKVRCLILPSEKRVGKLFKRLYGDRVEIVFGDIAEPTVCRQMIEGAHYVFNLAAVIPPKSDRYPELSERCNYIGVKNLIDCIESLGNTQPRFVHISTVALYGHRNFLHPWGRVGDPLLISPYDAYASAKLRGERLVLESACTQWAIIRQTAMLHNRMLTDNMSDGLMFHTCFNSPLEWATARDSGLLMKRIVERDRAGELKEDFWLRCFNLGSLDQNRNTGFNTFDDGFKLIAGSAEQFLKPNWNATRNFHGLWYYDGDELEKLFSYQKESAADYWSEISRERPYYALGKLVPPAIISFFAIRRLLSNYNAPAKWRKTGQTGKIIASFQSEAAFDSLPSDWKHFSLICKNSTESGSRLDYAALKDRKQAKLLSHGYDDSKADKALTAQDFKSAAEFRGGRLVSQAAQGGLRTALEWECAEGHRFTAKPYTVLKAGHWCPDCIPPYVWDFDRLAKRNPFYAQVWYDSHDRGENMKYWFDSNYKPCWEHWEDA